MYEIWLTMNILWEIALEIWPWLLGAAAAWAVLVVGASLRPGVRWRASLPVAVLVGLLVAGATFFLLPGALRSSLSEMGYWLDWMVLLGIAAGAGVAGAVMAWPVSALVSRGGLLRA